jgi:hypothetical protein
MEQEEESDSGREAALDLYIISLEKVRRHCGRITADPKATTATLCWIKKATGF